MRTFWQISGPLALLTAYAMAAALPLSSFPFDLYLSGAAGLYFCSRFRLKGCSYALMLLALSGLLSHLFLETHHFLRLGLEASLACSFFAAALSFEEEGEGWSAMEAQLRARASAIQNLEDELGKARELLLETQLASTAKADELRKNYEEIAAEKSSLEILNDVLRKANAAHFEEKGVFEKQALEEGRRLAEVTRHLERIRLETAQSKEAAHLEADRCLQEIEALKMDRSEMQERLAFAEKKVQDLAKTEALYRQLKTQFEEKNHVLQETRALLFKAETELQTRALEKEEQSTFLPEELRGELDRCDQEMAELQEENRHLQDLVTELTEEKRSSVSFAVHRTPLPAGQPSLEDTLRETLIPKRKKKTKKPAQQDLLF
jgi:hypothetical protein